MCLSIPDIFDTRFPRKAKLLVFVIKDICDILDIGPYKTYVKYVFCSGPHGNLEDQ